MTATEGEPTEEEARTLPAYLLTPFSIHPVTAMRPTTGVFDGQISRASEAVFLIREPERVDPP